MRDFPGTTDEWFGFWLVAAFGALAVAFIVWGPNV